MDGASLAVAFQVSFFDDTVEYFVGNGGPPAWSCDALFQVLPGFPDENHGLVSAHPGLPEVDADFGRH